MANKAIFDVDVNDAKFKAFATLVDKYYDQLTKMPTAWQNANAAMAPNAVVAALGAQNQLLSKFLEGEKAVASETERTERSWRGISEYTRSAANSLYSTVLSLAKWTGISAVLGSIVGAISLDRVAASVADTRRTAAGLGISYGQQQAFGLDLGRFVDPGAVLSAGRNALFDLTSPAYVALRAAGITPGAKDNAATVGASLLERLPQLLGGTPQELILPRARALGIDQFLGPDDIVRYMSATPEERKTQLEKFRKDSGRLNIEDKTARRFQDFLTNLDEAKIGIENTFVKGLGSTDGLVSQLNTQLTSLNTTISAFNPDLSTFNEDIKTIISGLSALAGWVRPFIPSGERPSSPGEAAVGPAKTGAVIGGVLGLFGGPGGALIGGGIGGAIGAGYGALKYANAEGDLLKLVGDLENASRNPNAVSSRGARGLYQIEPSTAEYYHRDPNQLYDPIYNEQTAQLILRALVKKYHGDIDKVLLAYHSGPGAVDDPSTVGPKGRGYIAAAHANPGYQKVVIEIHDATGGNPITAGAQTGLGGAP